LPAHHLRLPSPPVLSSFCLVHTLALSGRASPQSSIYSILVHSRLTTTSLRRTSYVRAAADKPHTSCKMPMLKNPLLQGGRGSGECAASHARYHQCLRSLQRMPGMQCMRSMLFIDEVCAPRPRRMRRMQRMRRMHCLPIAWQALHALHAMHVACLTGLGRFVCLIACASSSVPAKPAAHA
jgi:hypothetical protein